MTFWDELLANQVLMSAVTGWVVAQVLKTIIDLALNKSFNPERLDRAVCPAPTPQRYVE